MFQLDWIAIFQTKFVYFSQCTQHKPNAPQHTATDDERQHIGLSNAVCFSSLSLCTCVCGKQLGFRSITLLQSEQQQGSEQCLCLLLEKSSRVSICVHFPPPFSSAVFPHCFAKRESMRASSGSEMEEGKNFKN